MVSTRHHPRAYPPPELAVEGATSDGKASGGANPTATPAASSSKSKSGSVRAKSRPRVSTAKAKTVSPGPDSPSSPTSPSGAVVASSSSQRSRSTRRIWTHTPSHLTLIWLAISLPLVVWDTGYVLGRPHTMPGGWAHSPIWSPYKLYGTIDYIYGFPAWESHNGFTGAQGSLNVIETLMYFAYLWIVWANGKEQDSKTARGRSKKTVEGRGAPSKKVAGWFGEARIVGGSAAGAAVVIGFSASVMTLSKTVLYGLNEYFSGFENIGHNSFTDLIFLWIIPNGAWIVVPAWMTYAFGAEILEGLSIASGAPVPRPIATKEE